MKLILVDKNINICEAWQEEFEYVENVHIFNGRFEDIPEKFPQYLYFVMTAAGNSFGVMGGGIDFAIAKHFPKLELDVRRKIYNEWNGELNVGSAISIPILSGVGYIALIYTPTMRAPIRINNTENVYLATKATLQIWDSPIFKNHDENSVLVMPGFGGGCGDVCPISIAKQMSLAYRNHTTKRMETDTLSMRKAHNDVLHAVKY